MSLPTQVDMCSLEEVDEMARMPNSIPISCSDPPLNLDGLLERIWDMMALVRKLQADLGIRACFACPFFQGLPDTHRLLWYDTHQLLWYLASGQTGSCKQNFDHEVHLRPHPHQVSLRLLLTHLVSVIFSLFHFMLPDRCVCTPRKQAPALTLQTQWYSHMIGLAPL